MSVGFGSPMALPHGGLNYGRGFWSRSSEPEPDHRGLWLVVGSPTLLDHTAAVRGATQPRSRRATAGFAAGPGRTDEFGVPRQVHGRDFYPVSRGASRLAPMAARIGPLVVVSLTSLAVFGDSGWWKGQNG